MIQNYN